MDNRYLIIADDFTGANDTGVQLRRRGFPTEVLFSGKPVCQDKSVVIDTESRTVHPDHAYEIVSHALEQVDFSQFRHIIKKIDSTMRGNIAMEIRAVDEAFHPELIVFAPALPALGRTTVDGVQRLHGVEICKTELSRDPKNPVVEDNLVSLLGRIYEERIQLKRLPEIRSSSFSLTDSRIFVCDAETDEDLSRIVQAARRSQKTALYIGTAGIADSLMELEQPSLPSLGVAASISTVTNRQMHFCEQQGITLIKLPVDKILQGSDTAERYIQKAVEALNRGEDTIFLTDTAYDREFLELSYQAGDTLGLTPLEIGDRVRSIIGHGATEILRQAKVSGVFLTGGDTALGLLMNVGADGSEILSEIMVGIPLIQVKGGEFDGLKLVTKAGAFGADNAIAFAMRKLKEHL